ncbi:MAG: DNA polymerase, partial [Fusobacteriaceae bacterium]
MRIERERRVNNMDCQLCELHKFSCPSQIPGSGNDKSDIMIINSYASDECEEAQEATMDDDLKNYLKKNNIKPKEVYYTNAVKCRTPKDRKIKVSEVKKCKIHLQEEIKRVKPKYVLLLGAQSVQAAIDRKITDIQGTITEVEGISYVATYSPRTIFYDVKKAPQIQKSLDLFAALVRGEDTQIQVNPNVIEIKSLKDAKKAFNSYVYPAIAFDIETSGLNRYKENINLIGFGNDKVQYIIDVGTRYSPFKGYPRARQKVINYILKQLDEYKVIGSNIKFDNLFCREHYGFSPKAGFDVMLASHLLDENTANGLKENAIFKCGAQEWDIDKKLKTGNLENLTDYKNYKNYLAYDILWTYKLYKYFRKELKADKALYKIYENLVMPAARAYEDIEELGVYVYQDRFKELEKQLRQKQADILAQLKPFEDLVGREINWASSAQIKKVLYEDLDLPILEKTEAGQPSTGESVLMRLREYSPLPQLILDFRGVTIQISHFVDGWKERMHEGRLHPNFKLHGTVTGRTACDNPNLQQVPRDKAIRSLIGAPPGWTMIESDYSQLELRVTALVSGDEAMTQLFRIGEDIHTNTGRAVSGKHDLS